MSMTNQAATKKRIYSATAAANFLGSLHGLTCSEARMNLCADACTYGWSDATVREIGRGIDAHYLALLTKDPK